MWYVFAALSTALWGFSDVLFERFFNEKDPLHTLKYLPFTGMFAFVSLVCLMPFSEEQTGLMSLLAEHKTFMIVPLCYIVALILEEKSLKDVSQSIISPVSNTSCLIIFYVLIAIYKATGKTDAIQMLCSPLNLAGSVMIILGLAVLTLSDIRSLKGTKIGKTILIPLLLAACFDAGETISEALLIDGIVSDSVVELGCFDFLILYCFYTGIICVFVYFYICFKEKKIYNPFDCRSAKRAVTTFVEFEPNILYCMALETVPVLTAFISSCYSIFTVVFCAAINKTGLRKKEIVPVSMIIAGIVMFGIAEALS